MGRTVTMKPYVVEPFKAFDRKPDGHRTGKGVSCELFFSFICSATEVQASEAGFLRAWIS